MSTKPIRPAAANCIDLSAAALHLIAMALMLMDHLWATLLPAQEWLTCAGRLAFPIFAFMTVEGYFHTRNLKRYALRLLLFALLSEVPFDLMYGGTWFYPVHQNVIWTLLLGLLGIHLMETVRKKQKTWLYLLTALLVVLIGTVLGTLSMVDYYGSPTPLQQIAAISSPDARTLLISPWDKTAVKSIEKAIQNSDLGINPQNDGASIRLSFPQLTEERRKELVKQIHKYAENGKVAIRNIRRDAMEAFKKKEKASEITEDDLKQAEKDLQKLTDDSCKELDALLAKKEKELMAL